MKPTPRFTQPDPVELARLLPAPGDPELPRNRHRQLEDAVMAHIQQLHSAAGPDPADAPRPARRRLRRPVLIGIPVALALAGVAVVALNTAGGPAGPGEPAPVAAPVVNIQAGSDLTLASTVEHIAEAADRDALPAPRPNQFIYVKSKVSYTTTYVNGDTNSSHTWVQPLHAREVWLSPDGRKGWLDEPGYQPEEGITLDSDVTRDSYNETKSLPTDPAALLKKIYACTNGESDRDQQAFATIGDIVGEQLVPARTAAALYRAAAKIPGVVVVAHSQDAAGRDGIALARLDPQTGQRIEWIFDRDTFAYLGSRGLQVAPGHDAEPGTVTERTAILQRTVVDEEKERPASPGRAS
ncbi:CU044_5270 family protein [Streptomyces sp. NPDC093064]|uniref:CU044_5270 family protein n=1 Tax=Streptomyces sp. NPDC093064 TaxID=3366020 RepID=UPI00382B2C7C